MSNTGTYFWKSHNRYLPIATGVLALSGIGIGAFYLYGREKDVYSKEFFLDENSAQELADFLEWLRLWMSKPETPHMPDFPGGPSIQTEEMTTSSVAPREFFAELSIESWTLIGIAVLVLAAICFVIASRHIELQKSGIKP